MNYSEYVKQTFQIQPSLNAKSVVAYFSDGTYQNINVSFDSEQDTCIDVNVEELHYRVANSINRQYANYSTNMLIGYSFTQDTDCYYFSTNKVDFLRFSGVHSSLNVHAVVDFELNSTLDDYKDIVNYSTITSYGTYSTQTSELSDFNFTIDNNFVIFDYTSLYYANGGYTTATRVIRGENVSFYEVYHYIEFYDIDNLYFSYGAPYYDIRNQSYQNGYGAGYQSGYVQGQEIGYNNGVNAQIDGNTATAFSYVSQAFNAVGGILELEVLPHVTLGLCFSIPLIFVLIMTIFKLVRK